MNLYGDYLKEDDKKNVKLESFCSEETLENGEYFEEDDKTNVKIEEQGNPEENIEIGKQILKAN